MKNLILFLISLFASNICFGQSMNVFSKPDLPQYIHVGSLPTDLNWAGNCQRVKVELFGGDYTDGPQSRVIYMVDSRGERRISKEITAGRFASHELKVFLRNNVYDVVVEVTGWAGYNIRSFILDYTVYPTDFNCVPYDISGKEEVTSLFAVTTLTVSDKFGNFGIGVEKPQSKLEVNGTIRAKEVKIEATGWSDFVFDKSYNLPKLSDVEKHINDRQHLPGIPSEKEVLENGVNVVDMQAKLLQKIEELTLYVIDLKKENEKQDKQNKDLQKQVNELKAQLNDNQP